MPNINQLIAAAEKSGFQSYLSVPEQDETADEVRIQHDILTCTEGQFSGEVIDIYYNYNTGFVHQTDYSCQFSDQSPKFRFT